jgi:hypothetical protein
MNITELAYGMRKVYVVILTALREGAGIEMVMDLHMIPKWHGAEVGVWEAHEGNDVVTRNFPNLSKEKEIGQLSRVRCAFLFGREPV